MPRGFGILASCAAILISACGYVGDPLPPTLNIPVAISDLEVIQRANRLYITFTVPALTTDGVLVREVGAVDLRIGRPVDPFNIESWAESAKAVAVEATEPGHVQVEVPANEWTGSDVVVAVRSSNTRGLFSEWSSPVALEVTAPVATPAGVTVEPHPAGLRVHWREEQPGTEYRVYRVQRDGPPELTATVARSEYVDEDVKPGVVYSYSIQAVRGSAESLRSAPVSGSVRDIFPPAVPAGITAVAGLNTIELAWERVPDPDLTAYRVYRSRAGEDFKVLAESVPVPAYTDKQVQAGQVFRYAISAIDAQGNESPRSAPVEVTAP